VNILFTPIAWEDYRAWADADAPVTRRINSLVGELRRDPSSGMGQPERLRGALDGFWSRRLTGEHRLVYLVDGDNVVILQARYHHR
jgi:toxin YoeB